MLSLLEKSTWHTAFLSQSCSLLQSRIQSQSQPVTKETDEKLLYIHTRIHIRLLCCLCSLSLFLTHIYTPLHTILTLSVSHANFTHAVIMTTATLAFLHTLNQSIPPSSPLLSVKVSALLFSMSFHLSLCSCVTVCV